ncbi:hypothetical protein TRIP_B40285 [uncultured Desulfatiglans sp.]|nr:hypothetical protein TRIP_B40285 [uncultured Desulfatiglans sp.]
MSFTSCFGLINLTSSPNDSTQDSTSGLDEGLKINVVLPSRFLTIFRFGLQTLSATKTAAFPNRILWAAIIDRLRHGAYKVMREGKSYRSPQGTQKDQKITCSKTQKTPVRKGVKSVDLTSASRPFPATF